MINQSPQRKRNPALSLLIWCIKLHTHTHTAKKWKKKPAIGYFRSPTFISNFHLVPSPAIFTKKKEKQFTSIPYPRLEAKHASSTHLFSFLSFFFSFFLSLSFYPTNQTTRSNLPSPFLTIFSFFKAALGGQGASKTSFNSSNVRPLVSTPMKYHMIPITTKTKKK